MGQNTQLAAPNHLKNHPIDYTMAWCIERMRQGQTECPLKVTIDSLSGKQLASYFVDHEISPGRPDCPGTSQTRPIAPDWRTK